MTQFVNTHDTESHIIKRNKNVNSHVVAWNDMHDTILPNGNLPIHVYEVCFEIAILGFIQSFSIKYIFNNILTKKEFVFIF